MNSNLVTYELRVPFMSEDRPHFSTLQRRSIPESHTKFLSKTQANQNDTQTTIQGCLQKGA